MTAGGESVKYLDITGWSDTGVGACSVISAPRRGHACPLAFTGHFYGSGCTVKFSYDEDVDMSAEGGLGLFPCMRGAHISNLVLDVTQASHLPQNINSETERAFDAALGAFAGEGTIVEEIEVTQRFVQSERDAAGTESTPAHRVYDASFMSAGVVGLNDAGSVVRNCRVTSRPNVHEDGTEVRNTRLFFYAGIALINNGEISGCEYFYRAGDNAMFWCVSGIARNNCGRIEDCYAELYASGISAGGSAGISEAVNGGEIVNCTARVNMDAVLGLNLERSVKNGGLVSALNCADVEALIERGPVRISGCTVTGGTIAGHVAGGLIGFIDPYSDYPVEISGCEVRLADVGTPDENNNSVGGLIGTAVLSQKLTVADCSSTANVTGGVGVGGMFGSISFQDAVSPSVFTEAWFTVTNCHSYADSVRGVKTNMIGSTGGFIGMLYKNTRTAEDNSTVIENCTARAEVISYSSCAGGFVGNIYQREPAVKPVGREYTFKDCAAYGNVYVQGSWPIPENASVENGDGGGFIGHIDNTDAANISVKGCVASGNVEGVNAQRSERYHHMAGFIGLSYNNSLKLEDCKAYGNVEGLGGLGGFGGRLENAKIVNCEARGRVVGEWEMGGFVGYLFGSQVSNSRAYGNVVGSNGGPEPQTVGGFFGYVGRNSILEQCTAYGDAVGKTNGGGFGGIALLEAEGDGLTLVSCTSYGSATVSAHSAGGFIGYVTGPGMVRFTDCVAYGNAVAAERAAGFVSHTETTVKFLSFTRCASYGDADVTSTNTGSEAGGFGGFMKGVAAEFLSCTSAGSARNAGVAGNNNADAGGFIGVLAVPSTLNGCRAAAAVVAGSAGTAGTLIGACLTASGGSVIKNCQYRALSGIPMIGNGDVYGSAANGFDKVNAAENNTVNNAAIPGGAPSLTCAISKSAANNDITIAFANLANISGYVTEFAVSADGGRTYTQLIYTSADKAYDGYVLTPVAGVAIGGKLQAQAFNYTLKNLGGYDKSKVVVRIAFSSGFAKVFRGAAV